MKNVSRVYLWDVAMVGPYVATVLLIPFFMLIMMIGVSGNDEMFGALIILFMIVMFVVGCAAIVAGIASWIFMLSKLYSPEIKTIPEDQRILWLLGLIFVQPVFVIVMYFVHVRPILLKK